ncbi:MAG: glycosyltransferase family 4 protein [Chloroflexi bacterium]|nr:glycosyltransferase family 4 protein [Chloroflexota bacterium]
MIQKSAPFRSVLFVDHAPVLGGAEQSLLLLLQYLDRAEWQPHLACVPGQLADRAMRAGLPCHLFSLPRLRRSPRFAADGARSARQLARLARQVQANAIYANTVRAALYAAPAARLAKRPFFWHMRDFWLSETKPRHIRADTAVKRLLCASATQVIANSHAVAQQLPCAGKTAVVHNGIEVDKFDPRLDGRPFRAQHGIPEDTPLVGMVGRLRPWKGQLPFLHMATHILRQQPEVYFVVVGGANFAVEDDYARQVTHLAQELGIAGQVVFTGMLDDVRPPLAAMDVFVHPGEPEPFGLVNIEAMAMARPVVAFAHGALPEIVQNNVTGLLTPPGSVPALAEAVIGLLTDDEKRRQMGDNGRRRAETHFTIQRTAREVGKVMQRGVSR